MSNIKNSFKTKNFKYGGYATAITALLVAILFVLNMVVGKLDIKADMTKNGMFSLSDQSKKVLQGLKQPINIYGFYESGKEDETVSNILEKYKAASSKVTVQYKDPTKYPAFAQKYSQEGTNVTEGTVVIECGSNFKTISGSDLVNYDYSSGQPSPSSLAVEERVTSAIVSVTSGKSVNLYTLKGHSEGDLTQEIATQLKDQNYTIKDLNLLTKDANLTPDDLVVIVSPKKDLSTDELDKLKTFLGKGGKAIFLMDILNQELPNFQAVFNAYGVELKSNVVVEGDSSHIVQNPIYLLPDMGTSDILKPIKSQKLSLLMPASQYIANYKLKKETTTIESLLTTTKNSWAKKDVKASTLEKQSGDAEGPFNIAVAITDNSISSSKPAKLVVVGNSTFAQSQFLSITKNANLNFFVNCVNWTQDIKDKVNITPKQLTGDPVQMNTVQQMTTLAFVVLVIPVAIAISGVYVLTRRKHQ